MLSALLIKTFNMSIAAGVVVLAVVLARLVLKRAPKWLRCALWVLVAVRLIIPALPQSPVSLVPSAETIVIKQTEQAAGREQSGSTGVQQDPEPFDMPYTDPAETQTIEIHSGIPFINYWAEDELARNSSSPTETGPGKKVSFLDVAGYVWLCGLVAMVCYAVVSFARLRAKVRASVLRDNAIHVCDDIDSPFILGVIRPRIYLPSGLSRDAETYVLAHERAHLSRRDQLWKPLGYVLLSIYWFNPLMWLAYVLFCRDIEYACDEKVVVGINEAERADYSRALLSCSVSHRVIAACPLAFGELGVKDRVKSALNYKKPAFWVIAAAVVICLALAVCFLTDPKEKAMQGKVTEWFEDEQFAEGRGPVISLPEYPGVEFRKDTDIHMIKDGLDEIVVKAWFYIRNAYFCDLDGDGKPELCTTCSVGSGMIDERIVVYVPADGSTLELQDRGNFDYTLDVRDGKLIVMKRAYEKTSSVGEDGLLVIKDGTLAMTSLSDGSGKPYGSTDAPEASEFMRKAVQEDWAEWNKRSEEEKMYSSKMPGTCWKYFSTWEEAKSYFGADLWNPLETADQLEKKNYAGADIGTGGLEEGYMHAYMFWDGSEEGDVSYYMLQSGYAYGEDRIIIQISNNVQSSEELKRTDRFTDKYYAIDMEFPRNGLQYQVTVISIEGAESCEATYAKILSLLFEGTELRLLVHDPDAISERKMTLDDIKFMLQERNTLKAEVLRRCTYRDVGSGSHVYVFEIDDIFALELSSSFSLSQLTSRGAVIADLDLRLVYNNGEDDISIFSDGLQAFIEKHSAD